MSQKILIIEDEPDIRKTLEYNISREGYEVISASSLSEGREKLESASFSLLLLDLMLPDGSGLDLCRELKQDKSLSSMPVIILTAKDDEVDKVVGFELGADDYFNVPTLRQHQKHLHMNRASCKNIEQARDFDNAEK